MVFSVNYLPLVSRLKSSFRLIWSIVKGKKKTTTLLSYFRLKSLHNVCDHLCSWRSDWLNRGVYSDEVEGCIHMEISSRSWIVMNSVSKELSTPFKKKKEFLQGCELVAWFLGHILAETRLGHRIFASWLMQTGKIPSCWTGVCWCVPPDIWAKAPTTSSFSSSSIIRIILSR